MNKDWVSVDGKYINKNHICYIEVERSQFMYSKNARYDISIFLTNGRTVCLQNFNESDYNKLVQEITDCFIEDKSDKNDR